MAGSTTTGTANYDHRMGRSTPPSAGYAVLDITGLATPYQVPQAMYLNTYLKVVGVLTEAFVLKLPLASGADRKWRAQWQNATTGAYSLTLEGPSGGSGVTLTRTKTAWLNADAAAITKEPEF